MKAPGLGAGILRTHADPGRPQQVVLRFQIFEGEDEVEDVLVTDLGYGSWRGILGSQRAVLTAAECQPCPRDGRALEDPAPVDEVRGCVNGTLSLLL